MEQRADLCHRTNISSMLMPNSRRVSKETYIGPKTVIVLLVVVVGGTGMYYWAMYLKGNL